MNKDISGSLVIFHAGSLAIPFREMKEAFNRHYPRVKIYLEGAGSRTCARKITDLGKPCDIMASADYTVIDNLLIPDYASWNIHFATNEMVIMYRKDSAYAASINGTNWHHTLLKDGVQYGHSDPNSDPCGYRTLIVWQLAEKFYHRPGLYEELKAHCPRKNIRPKETDLLALLETGELDYLFIYRSIAQQHHMPFITLPAQINLNAAEFEKFYNSASLEITGKRPGEHITKRGKPMVYGITVCRNAPNRRAALAFVAFVTGAAGQAIMQKNGQPPISPPVVTGDTGKMPSYLKRVISQ